MGDDAPAARTDLFDELLSGLDVRSLRDGVSYTLTVCSCRRVD